MRMSAGSLAVVALLASAPNALAHEGHGDPAWFGSALHDVLEPAHHPMTLGLSIALVMASKWVANRVAHWSGGMRRR